MIDNGTEKLLSLPVLAARAGITRRELQVQCWDAKWPAPDVVGAHGAFLWRESTVAPWLEYRRAKAELERQRRQLHEQAATTWEGRTDVGPRRGAVAHT
ncbi:hypothetical protein [Burkholderia cepacia]|uniref:hypothetical protein n=1 Tax=Burkholderia cepacia TaxID=292 RepID=UPI00158CF13F|nr:hypothetical protein [Burkholderia cepacia]